MAPSAAPAQQTQLVLPLLVASRVDIGRLLRELEMIDEAVSQAKIRAVQTGGGQVALPRMTQLMDKTIELNHLDLTDDTQRHGLQTFLLQVREHAPVLHLSFSADPSSSFIERLMAWLRKELDSNMLVTIGLQPNIGAGCIVRTTNRYFDLSLRQDFDKKRDLLIEKLHAVAMQDNQVAQEAQA